MANFCDFNMKITGHEPDVKELISMFRREGPFIEDGLGRVYDLDVMEFEETKHQGIFEATCLGDCAWSIKSSMREDGVRDPSLESECERLGLVVEAYSSEPGNGFQEHLLIVKGDVMIDECVDYEEHFVDGYVSIEAYNADHDTEFTNDMINEDGIICIGGFGDDYGVFEDAIEYFVEEKTMDKTALDQVISNASEVAKEPFKELLPERCYGILPFSGAVIIIARGESGYYQTDINYGSKDENQQLVDLYNDKLGVTKAQAAAMRAGSMFGWDVPAANPASYDEQGNLLHNKVREAARSDEKEIL